MCREICDGAGADICDGAPLTCSSLLYIGSYKYFHHFQLFDAKKKALLISKNLQSAQNVLQILAN